MTKPNPEIGELLTELRQSCRRMAVTIEPNDSSRWPEIEAVLYDMCSNIIYVCLSPLAKR
jgi:hypothetical protein